MSEIDKMAEEFAAGRVPFGDYGHGDVVAAIRAALLTAPPGWKLVPVEPTEEMVDASMISVALSKYGRRATLRVLGARAWGAMLAAAPEPK